MENYIDCKVEKVFPDESLFLLPASSAHFFFTLSLSPRRPSLLLQGMNLESHSRAKKIF
jgi:hypothetical protein